MTQDRDIQEPPRERRAWLLWATAAVVLIAAIGRVRGAGQPDQPLTTDSPPPRERSGRAWWKREALTLPVEGTRANWAVTGIVVVSLAVSVVMLFVQFPDWSELTVPVAVQVVGVSFVSLLLASLTFARFEKRGQQIVATFFTLACVVLSTGILTRIPPF